MHLGCPWRTGTSFFPWNWSQIWNLLLRRCLKYPLRGFTNLFVTTNVTTICLFAALEPWTFRLKSNTFYQIENTTWCVHKFWNYNFKNYYQWLTTCNKHDHFFLLLHTRPNFRYKPYGSEMSGPRDLNTGGAPARDFFDKYFNKYSLGGGGSGLVYTY